MHCVTLHPVMRRANLSSSSERPVGGGAEPESSLRLCTARPWTVLTWVARARIGVLRPGLGARAACDGRLCSIGWCRFIALLQKGVKGALIGRASFGLLERVKGLHEFAQLVLLGLQTFLLAGQIRGQGRVVGLAVHEAAMATFAAVLAGAGNFLAQR